jgi:hypothetical protein
MFDYVTALFRQKILQSQGNRLGAHVIVSNSLAKAQMKSTADFLRRVHRLGKKHPELKLVFMLDRFLTTLYDRVRQAEIEFRKRWPLLPERVAERMQDVNSDGYVLLDDSSGTQIADWVLDQPEFELPADAAKISRGLEDTMTKS